MSEIITRTKGGAIEKIPDQSRKAELLALKGTKKSLKGKKAADLTTADMKVLVYEIAVKLGLITN